MRERDWEGPNGTIGQFVKEESQRTLKAYAAQPSLVSEQANQEMDTARGGYAHRQVIELIQNSADQIATAQGHGNGRILIRLSPTHLYCADDGAPLTRDGAKALLFSHLSPKRDTVEIGRFGVGFKAVLRISDQPAVFSRSGSIQFDRSRAASRMSKNTPEAPHTPVLRVADPIDAVTESKQDPTLMSLMDWAVNIVRLPLLPGVEEELEAQINSFRAEFLLFAQHVQQLDLRHVHKDRDVETRYLTLTSAGNTHKLSDNELESIWKVFEREHHLSEEATNDRRSLDDGATVRIVWAAPRPESNPPQEFWAYFPTQTSSLVNGILNAPWKTNEDRQSLLPGRYNDELITATADLVANSLRSLFDQTSPGRHLEYLPRREEAGDNPYANRLRRQTYELLQERAVIPNQLGDLRSISQLKVAPQAVHSGQQVDPELLALWASYQHRPINWVHHDALSGGRLTAIGRITDGGATQRGALERASVIDWVQALVRSGITQGDPAGASAAAIKVAATLENRNKVPVHRRNRDNADLYGDIVLTQAGHWAPAIRDTVFLASGSSDEPSVTVHQQLMDDPDVVEALKALGIQSPTAESAFRRVAEQMLGDVDVVNTATDWEEFWKLSREVDQHQFLADVLERDGWRHQVYARALDGKWRSIRQLLWPGAIVPADGSRDSAFGVDSKFHTLDRSRLEALGVVEPLRVDNWDFSDHFESEGPLHDYAWERINAYYSRDDLPRNPQGQYYPFAGRPTSGPLNVFSELSIEGRSRLTHALLELEATFARWKMWHETTDNAYPIEEVESPAVYLLRRFGVVHTQSGLHRITDGLGERPQQHDVRRWLLDHPNAQLIAEAFDLPAQLGHLSPRDEEDPVLLVDEWPGLAQHLAHDRQSFNILRCEALVDDSGTRSLEECLLQPESKRVVLVRQEDDREELELVVRELGLDLNGAQFERILQRLTSDEVAQRRKAVKQEPNDALRLLKAVGGSMELLTRLPRSLVDILHGEGNLESERIAEAAIATHHTAVLREYRDQLNHLDPPRQWAGRRRTLEFVRSLGFPDEWAGNPKVKRDQYVDVVGPRSMPDLHPYQRHAADNVRLLMRKQGTSGENRGLLSLPTGSGKTRVAVQAIIEAIRDDGFSGTVLWVADRDELCEQAVEAWQQAWMSFGPEASSLRISRLWRGQPQPEERVGATHVIVATIQTLTAKIKRANGLPYYLEDVGLLVIDEAHGSIAPTYTSLLTELGLTFRRTVDEIALLGLTATPYRGTNEEETRRLVQRYGANRLDSGAFKSDDPQDVIRELQRMKVLSAVDHAVIEGTSLSLDQNELQQVKDLRRLPVSAERRIADNTARTRRIIEAYETNIRDFDPECPTLIFATSVDHANTLAAMLHLRGVPARAISGDTDLHVRCNAVGEFRSGRLKVLVNYAVFPEGFDAPQTRALIVARPVYSPNLYFQMIGRGLRGKLNGGSERCLILDVHDNIVNYDRQLAYTELDDLWS